MSNTSVKVKASPARSESKPSATDRMTGAYDVGHRGARAAAKGDSGSDGDGKAKQATSASSAADGAAERNPSVFDGVAEKIQPYVDKHGHALVYGIIGIAAAALILTIGFWPVLLLAAFAAIGIAVGKFRDSGIDMQTAAKSLVGNLRR